MGLWKSLSLRSKTESGSIPLFRILGNIDIQAPVQAWRDRCGRQNLDRTFTQKVIVKVGQAAVQWDVVRRTRVHKARQVEDKCHELVKIDSLSTATCKIEAFSDFLLRDEQFGNPVVSQKAKDLGKLHA